MRRIVLNLCFFLFFINPIIAQSQLYFNDYEQEEKRKRDLGDRDYKYSKIEIYHLNNGAIRFKSWSGDIYIGPTNKIKFISLLKKGKKWLAINSKEAIEFEKTIGVFNAKASANSDEFFEVELKFVGGQKYSIVRVTGKHDLVFNDLIDIEMTEESEFIELISLLNGSNKNRVNTLFK